MVYIALLIVGLFSLQQSMFAEADSDEGCSLDALVEKSEGPKNLAETPSPDANNDEIKKPCSEGTKNKNDESIDDDEDDEDEDQDEFDPNNDDEDEDYEELEFLNNLSPEDGQNN